MGTPAVWALLLAWPRLAHFSGSREGTEVAGRRAGPEQLHGRPPVLSVVAGSCPLTGQDAQGGGRSSTGPRKVSTPGAGGASSSCSLLPRLDSANECLLVNVLQLKNVAGLVLKEDSKM